MLVVRCTCTHACIHTTRLVRSIHDLAICNNKTLKSLYGNIIE